MWIDESAAGDTIAMDTASVRAAAAQTVQQVVRGCDAMGIHFQNLGSASGSYCICDPWESSVPGLVEEAGALGEQVVNAFLSYLNATVEAATRANRLDTDQAQALAAATPTVGGVDPTFGGMLAQAIVNDSNNAIIGTWLGSGSSTSQVDILLAMQGQSGGNAGLALNQIMIDHNDDMASIWLAPDGTSYAGRDDSGTKLYSDRQGDVGTMSDIHRDTYDENNNGSYDDNDI